MSQSQPSGNNGNKEKKPLTNGFLGFLQLPFDFFGKVLTVIKEDLRLAILWGVAVLLLVVLIVTLFLARSLSSLEQFSVVVLIVLVITFLYVYTDRTTKPKPDRITETTETFIPDIPKTFTEAIRRRLRAGTGGVIVPVGENQRGTPFHLFKKEEFFHLDTEEAVKAAEVQLAIATKHKWNNNTFCAAIFRNVNPDNYVIWNGQLSTDMNDPTRTAGVWIFAGQVRDEIRFGEAI